MTSQEAIKIIESESRRKLNNLSVSPHKAQVRTIDIYDVLQAESMAKRALEKQEKIKEIIANANQWSKEDITVKAQAFCDIEKILKG